MKSKSAIVSKVYPISAIIDEGMVVLQNYMKLEEVTPGPCGETYQMSHDANQAINIKAEAASDIEEEEEPVPITFPEIKAEPEVSCMCLSECSLLGRYHI
jgi:hypothetical protein